MDTSFWIEKWQQRQIGFHEGRPNASLQQWFSTMNLKAGDHVFVPLCGKSQDLLWLLGQGVRVTGVECSPLAVDEFFSENDLQPQRASGSEFGTQATVYRCGDLTLWRGDYFSLPPAVLNAMDAVYDRAALIALPPPLRVDYLAKQQKELRPGTPILLVTLDFQRDPVLCEGYQGPPFPHSDDMVFDQYRDFSMVTKLGQRDITEQEPKFRAQGADRVFEAAWLIQR